MRLTHLFSGKIIIARRVTTSGYKMALSTVTSVAMAIQPVADSSHEIATGVFGKQFKIYVDGGIDIQPGDRLRDIGTGNYYTVMPDGVSRRTMGSIDYTLVVVQKTKN